MILVSAGHYLQAQGASWNGHTEWPQAVLWRDLLVQYLGDIGESVPSGKLRDKVEYINAAQAVCAIEIHFNSAKVNGEHVGAGCESLYLNNSAKGKQLAEYIHTAVSNNFSPDRGVKPGYVEMDPNKGDLYFLKMTHSPACILEPQFIQHWDEIEHARATCCRDIARQLMLLLDRWGLM